MHDHIYLSFAIINSLIENVIIDLLIENMIIISLIENEIIISLLKFVIEKSIQRNKRAITIIV